MAHKKTKLAAVPKITEAEQIVSDLKNQIEAATKSQADKLRSSKEFLVSQLDITSKKYLTVNGYMMARTTIDQAAFGSDEGSDDFSHLANQIASEMAEAADLMAREVESTDCFDITEQMFDHYMDAMFVKGEHGLADTVRQLLIVNLLQNIGPSLEDIVSFREGTQSEIDKLSEALAAHETKPE